jgi:uncharacterized repeat protein (TIGR03803 family)
MNKFNWGMRACGIFLFWATTAVALPAQTFTTLHSFDYTDGAYLVAGLVQANDGYLYGTTESGGAYGYGTVFKVTPGGTLATLHSFNITDGAYPDGTLVQATNGDLYGTTFEGGNTGDNCPLLGPGGGCGTVFKITPGGTLTMLHSFDVTDGAYPIAGLVQDTDGNFYGTTGHGGASGNCVGGCGTVFKMTPNGTLTTLHSFAGADGAHPSAGLVQATNGDFYGTTRNGGAKVCTVGKQNHTCGTVFKITPSGTLTTLHNFDHTDGARPYAGLVQAANGDLYGTTYYGGANGNCRGFCGTVFKITLGGTLTTLHSFDNTDGAWPEGGLVQGTDGNLYGTTSYGANGQCGVGCGTVFKITPSGTLTTLHSFDVTDGAYPLAGLVQATDGNFYGTTDTGGTSNVCESGCGTVFSLSVGLGPFVKTLPTSGTVGAAVEILGTDLTGATSVTFNGTAANFTVKSKSEITTTVPAGATTGKVRVTFPRGTRSSNVPFRVK